MELRNIKETWNRATKTWSQASRATNAAIVAVAGLCMATPAICEPLNLLFIGNSYTYGYGSNRSVPTMVSDIAIAAGHPAPTFIDASVGSATLASHDATNTNVINIGLPMGQHWDRVILQDQSLMCTIFGSVAVHRSAFVSYFTKVRQHSPDAIAIGYETWSRAPLHPYFTSPQTYFPGGAAEMTAQIKNGYELSTADAIAAFGPGTSRVARVGEAWQAANWDRLHIDDMSHAQNRGSLLAAMVLYATIYGDATVQDIDHTGLVNLLLLSPEDGAFLSAAAQRTIGTVTPGNEIYWTNANTGASVAWRTDDTPEDGEFVLGAVALSNNDDPRWKLCARADVNLDGAMDLIWRHADTGEMRAWLMRGSETLRLVVLPTVADVRWELRAMADFNLDGIADFVWRNGATGENVVWRMRPPVGSGSSFALGGIALIEQLPSVRDANWQIEGVADFNGDDKPDVLWRNVRTAATAAWLMDGLAYQASVEITPTRTDVNWRVAAIADYDHDGKSDLVWRSLLTGEMELWLMDGVSQRAVVAMPTVADTSWRTLGQGAFASETRRDFNGDGYEDLVWRHASNGQNALWLMRDWDFARLVTLETIANANWTIAAVGDLTRDNKPDVLWRNSATGQNVLWIMDGLARRASIDVPTVAKTDWEVGAIADVNGDETNDLVWLDRGTGQMLAWVLDGTPEDGTWVRSLAPLEAMASARQRVRGSGRFLADGTYDLIVHDLDAAPGDALANQLWVMRGTERIAVTTLPGVADVEWGVRAVADFNRDGKPDVLWRHAATGRNLVWLMDGTGLAWSVELPRVGDVGWELAK